ncbi:23S rRNA (pseudouridine(1915)-N(3))-methyltransferase RlmH [Brevibacillus sp. NRS-1366]|uniref:23S rRNA (pseudouridine(1915)-N(3))-methyltransferase RlmH n=1 Tax=Brevibacillus sp. NRS-1366 TaxID=3233899 RepID=UPI003D234FAD
MEITVLTVGRMKDHSLKEGIEEYSKSLAVYCKMQIVEIPEEKLSDKISVCEIDRSRQKEGDHILSRLTPEQYVMALSMKGRMWTPQRLSMELDDLTAGGQNRIAFVIGGVNGLSDAVLERANEQLTFSQRVFPHQLARLVLLERVYRAFRISLGETI